MALRSNYPPPDIVSALGPIDPSSIRDAEEEKSAPWIVRKLVSSVTGRVVMSSWETLKASGTTVVCLSPWGDSSPFLLPCIRFRDVAVHTIIAATILKGGMAAVASPVMGPVSDMVVSTVGDSILVKIPVHLGFDLATKLANDLVFDKPVNHILPIYSSRLETTRVKTILITLKYKHTMEDAALGFYRGSVHQDASLFANVKDYISVGKGWFSPYLFASGRRPIIPRSMKPDVVFCHGPFLSGDYKIGETLLAESASVITFSSPPSSPPEIRSTLPVPLTSHAELPNISNMFSRSRTPSPEPALTVMPAPPLPRRLVILVVGLKPHRNLWTTSARPSESVLHYQLLNGCPALVVPVKLGAPLVAWDTLTLDDLWEVSLPSEGELAQHPKFHGIVEVLFEFLDLCVEWSRVDLSTNDGGRDTSVERHLRPAIQGNLNAKKTAVHEAVQLLLASAVRSGSSSEARRDVDKYRSGIAMWRIP